VLSKILNYDAESRSENFVSVIRFFILKLINEVDTEKH